MPTRGHSAWAEVSGHGGTARGWDIVVVHRSLGARVDTGRRDGGVASAVEGGTILVLEILALAVCLRTRNMGCDASRSGGWRLGVIGWA